MPLEHWKHYLALENDLSVIARYVEPATANYGTYSVELTKLFLSACSEVDVVCKVLCEQDAPGALTKRTKPRRQGQRKRLPNMNDYRAILHNTFSTMHSKKVRAARYELTFTPWADWSSVPGKNPRWWGDHNGVKHERDRNFDKASLENTLNAMSGLYVLLHFTHRDDREVSHRVRPDAVLTLEGESAGIFSSRKAKLVEV